ncbi:MAG: hypothetical protein WA639_17510 [Candidatus Acidiferrum sp.]
MKVGHGFGRTEKWGIAWLLLCLSFAANILDDALHDFVGYYDATVLTLYGHFSWFPRIDLSFRVWLVGVILSEAILLLLTPMAFRNSLFLRPMAYIFSVIMLFSGCGSILATMRGRTVPSVHFTGMAPGTYSSPLLLAASIYLLRRLRASA